MKAGGAKYTYFDHENAKYRRRNGVFPDNISSIDDVLVRGKWKPYEGSDPLAPAMFGDEIDDPLGGDGEGEAEAADAKVEEMAKADRPVLSSGA